VTGDSLADIERARNIGGEQLLPFIDRKSSSGERNCMPALLIRISIAPEFFSIASTPSFGACGCVTSKAGHRYLVPGAASLAAPHRAWLRRAVEDDLGAMFGKALCERKADSCEEAGDERPLARECEKFKCHVTIPCCLKPPGLIAQATS
jgi:hypothetical protein